MVGQLADMSLCVADNNAFCLPIGSIGILLYYLPAERSIVAVKVKLWAHVTSFLRQMHNFLLGSPYVGNIVHLQIA